MRVRVEIARTSADVLRAQHLIAEVYSRQYEVVFSRDRFDLEAKIEPWPHRYVLVHHGAELAAASGLYLRDTYTERFGQISAEDLARLLREAGAADRYDPGRLREVTKVTVNPRFRGHRLSAFLFGVANSRAFSQMEADAPHLMVFCAKDSLTHQSFHSTGLNSRVIRPFPFYKVHELYRSESDPMNSRLIIPDLDVPRRFYDMDIPGEYETDAMLEDRP